MAVIPGGVRVAGFMSTTDSSDKYPTHKAEYGFGGYREVADLTARGLIETERMSLGMLCYVLSQDTIYKLTQITPSVVWAELRTTSRKTVISKSFANHNQTLTVAELDFTHIYVTTTGGVTLLKLPTLTAAEDGIVCTLKRIGVNTFTIQAPGGVNIDTANTFVFSANQEAIEIVYVHGGTPVWHIIGRTTAAGSLWTDLGSVLQPTGGESVSVGAGTWDGPHLIMGTFHLWVDGDDRMRMKDGTPTSATDGTVVGMQGE